LDELLPISIDFQVVQVDPLDVFKDQDRAAFEIVRGFQAGFIPDDLEVVRAGSKRKLGRDLDLSWG
jgi:hypothetical protein